VPGEKWAIGAEEGVGGAGGSSAGTCVASVGIGSVEGVALTSAGGVALCVASGTGEAVGVREADLWQAAIVAVTRIARARRARRIGE